MNATMGLRVLLARLRDRWDLRPGEPIVHSTSGGVIPVTRSSGEAAVLKIIGPGLPFEREVAALRAFDGRGVVRVLDADADSGVLLLERLEPGEPLAAVHDDASSMRAASVVMRAMSTPAHAGHAFPTTTGWAAGLSDLRARFDGGTGPFPAGLVDTAERVFDELHASAVERVLLHGDLHHGNLRSATREPWLAIDPKGVVGEPAYEPGALLRNPLPDLLNEPSPRRVVARRIDRLSGELDLDRGRIAGYAFAQAVLAAWWELEDEGGGWTPLIQCAEILREW